MVQTPWKAVWGFLTKLNTFLPYDLVCELLGIYPKELKTYAPSKTYTLILVAALFINAKNLEATKMSFSRRMDKQTVVHPNCGLLFRDKKINELFSAKLQSSHERTLRKLNAYY